MSKDFVACEGKVRYSAYDIAVAAAVRCTQGGMKVRPKQMQPYQCAKCRGYHLTSRPWRDELERFPAIEA
jgi:ribosome modulation factor